jgi:hypothetical protein
MVGMNLTKVHCKHIWKCHKETSCTTLYMNKKVFKKLELLYDPFLGIYQKGCK